ncbi:hypothetical protein A5906_02060 [Bradyrhizobium sacchari]|uniref:Uncharacterized protein DUF1236 n=1 Tax=Bradyrhizobium sacchari TaxID=1399419 RepID=A0A560KL70_9BRAD|nr:DUF1236 domain-containing protein [Bradyrhizobium sacchari]OPY96092.1 hypothetical protein A5906_02060 [Bradyrhizobium sacchari]TWB66781.1 uncharacterized protein DUF1236 [Bradyrhizobium sacchari]TWB84018.1 uncharacterized protein DUF1236 [Bradyrhizobium sacchari]
MLNRFMISVAALALVAGTGLANAQDKGRDSGGAGSQQQMQHSQPSGGAAERGSMGRDSAHEKGTVGQAGGAGSMKSDRAAEDKSSGAMKDEHQGREMNKNAAEDKAGATKGQRTDERAQGHQDKSKSMSQDTSKDTTKSGQKDKDMKAEGSKSGTSTNNAENQKGTTSTNQNAQGQTGTSTSQNAQGQTSTSTTVGQAGAGAKLSTEQRTQITSVIREQRVAPVSNVNFSVSVGTRIPREGIELHALPSRVATIYPEWRNYRYVMVREQIVIIDPNTYEIVAILDV